MPAYRARPLPRSLRHGAGGIGFKTQRPPLSRRKVSALDRGEEPAASRDDAGNGVDPMTTLAKLLEQKQQFIERLHEEPGPEEREQIERLLE